MIEETLTGSTLDIAEENIAKLKQIFPDAFAEGKVDFDKLKQDLGEYINENSDRYNFNWHGKGQALRLAQTPSTGTLRPFKEESKNWDTTQNLYIEGDNLEVLKLLQKSYHGKVRMIYIDPPYNTGNDFVYPDDYKDSIDNYLKITGQVDDTGEKLGTNRETSGRYHTDWLNMMYPRLRLARNLLTDDGVIFISIDDNEVVNLRKCCDDVFGEDNYINLVSLKTKASSGASGGGEDKRLKKNNEYILIYSKIRKELDIDQPIEKIKISDFIKEHKENNTGFYYTRILEEQGTKKLLAEIGEMKIYEHRDFKFSTISEKMSMDHLTLDEAYVKYFDKVFMVTNAQTSLLGKVNDLTPAEHMLISYEYVPKTGRNKGERIVKFIWNKTLVVWFADSAEKDNNFAYKYENLGTLWDDISWGRLDLQGDVPFKNGKKPLKLLERFLKMSTDTDSIILDFFSGSATTAHAVMQLNAEDGGSRKFIMVQLPESTNEKDEEYKAGYRNICEIGKERIRRAGEKMKAELTEKQNGQTISTDNSVVVNPDDLDIGFKVLKLDSSNLKKWNPDYDNLEQSLQNMIGNYVPGRTELDVVYEIMLKYGLPPTLPVEQSKVPNTDCNLYSIGFGALVICLNDHITVDVANAIVQLKRELQPENGMRAVFKDNGFKDDSTKTNTIEILKLAGVAEFVTI